MLLTVTASRRAVRTLASADITPAQCAEAFSTFEVGEKDGEAFIPAVFAPCPPTCRNAKKGLDCGGNTQHRLGANVTHMTGLGADLDHLPEGRIHEILTQLEARGITFYAWNTHGHAPPMDCRARVVIPFATPVPISNPRQWSQVFWPALIKYLGLDGLAGADVACRDPARVYYTPRKPTADAVRGWWRNEGTTFDPTPLLGSAVKEAVAVSLPPLAPQDPTKPVDLEDVRRRLAAVKKAGTSPLVKNVLAGRAPTPPPEQRVPPQPSRYLAWLKVTGVLGMVAEEWEGSNALLEVLRDSYSAEVAESPEDHTAWDTIVQLFESARKGAPAFRAQQEAERKARLEVFKNTLDPGEPPFIPPPTQAVVEGNSIAADVVVFDPDAWKKELILQESANGMPRIKNSAENVEVVLRAHPEWAGVLRYNEMTKGVEMHGGPFGNKDGSPRPVKDSDAANTTDWLARRLELCQNDNVVWSRMMSVADKNSYDPLKRYLEGLVWDGTPRLAGMLVKYFGASTKDLSGDDITEHLETVGTKFMISAVARGLRPGCKADAMLELEGAQGIGKSTALQILGGEWYTDASIDIGTKDSLLVVSQSWIVEMSELDSLRKSEVTAQRAFLSKTFDEFRPPYGRVTGRYQRRCVFAGTTNSQDYLSDTAGNRRHLPVECTEIDKEALKRDRDQLWAESVAMFRAGAQWHLAVSEQAIANKQTDQRLAADPVAEQVKDHLLKLAPENRPTHLTAFDVCVITEQRTSHGVAISISKSMARLGFKRVLVGKDRSRAYKVTDDILKAPLRPSLGIGQKHKPDHIKPVTNLFDSSDPPRE